ncbi:MAG: hypothetical protein J6U23_04300 [Clostridiales bacterium]|nr:hypothetical protein [Clostridiales bacterium]
MKYDETGLPEKVKAYLEEIYNDEGLSDAFFDCDVEILDEACITDMEDDCSWLDDLMGPSQSRESFYEDIKPFAMDGTGAVWVILNDELVGYIGTEGECGIVARNIDEFMNIIAYGRYFSDYSIEHLKSEEYFISSYTEPEDDEHREVFDRFIEKHGFTKDPHKLYEMIIAGLTVKPFFEFRSTDDDYCDSYSILGSDDGQEALEKLIDLLKIDKK